MALHGGHPRSGHEVGARGERSRKQARCRPQRVDRSARAAATREAHDAEAPAVPEASQGETEALADFDEAGEPRAAECPKEPPVLQPTPLMLPSASSPASLLMPLRARQLYTPDGAL